MTAPAITHIDREFDEFIDRVVDRARKSFRWLDRNRWVDPIELTRQKDYDQETERLRAQVTTRKAAA